MIQNHVPDSVEKKAPQMSRHDTYTRCVAQSSCKTRNETKPNQTKFTETKRNKSKRNSPKRNGIIQNEIKPILTKQFLGERQDKN